MWTGLTNSHHPSSNSVWVKSSFYYDQDRISIARLNLMLNNWCKSCFRSPVCYLREHSLIPLFKNANPIGGLLVQCLTNLLRLGSAVRGSWAQPVPYFPFPLVQNFLGSWISSTHSFLLWQTPRLQPLWPPNTRPLLQTPLTQPSQRSFFFSLTDRLLITTVSNCLHNGHEHMAHLTLTC